MLSVASSQSLETPVTGGRRSNFGALIKRSIFERTVPVELRELIKRCYNLEEDSDAFLLPGNPNKLFIVYRGQLRTIDLLAWRAIQQGNVPPNNNEARNYPGSDLDDSTTDGQVAPPATPVSPVHPSSAVLQWNSVGRVKCDWQKTISDKDRELLHKERRRLGAYKTSLCHKFRDKGECPYGPHCSFAHGVDELRPAPSPHPKYKTQLCNKFALYGSCPYGPRCQFIHLRPQNMQDNYTPPTNFSASLDSRIPQAFTTYRVQYCNGVNPRANCNTFVVQPTPCRHDLFRQRFATSNSFPQDSGVEAHYNCPPEPRWINHSSDQDVACNTNQKSLIWEPPNDSASGELDKNIEALDDLLSTMSIGEMSNPFTQSCFPRITSDDHAETGAGVNSNEVVNDIGPSYDLWN